MDEVKVEKTPTSTHTTINRSETKSSGSSSMIWFVVGGLLVAVAVVFYLVMGGDTPATTASTPAGGDVSVNVDTGSEPAAETSNDAVSSEPAAPAPAPAEE